MNIMTIDIAGSVAFVIVLFVLCIIGMYRFEPRLMHQLTNRVLHHEKHRVRSRHAMRKRRW